MIELITFLNANLKMLSALGSVLLFAGSVGKGFYIFKQLKKDHTELTESIYGKEGLKEKFDALRTEFNDLQSEMKWKSKYETQTLNSLDEKLKEISRKINL